MAYSVHVPRVNNNDDFVKIVQIDATVGQQVKKGDVIAAVETDKSVVEVEAEQDGYVLGIVPEQDETAAVGSVLMWFGTRADEPIPESVAAKTDSGARQSAAPTAKARVLLEKYGLDAGMIPTSGERLTVKDIDAFRAGRGIESTAQRAHLNSAEDEATPAVPGASMPLSTEEHGMLNTVLWHRDHAVASYLEVEYDPGPWDEYAADFAKKHKLLFSPLLSLLAYELVVVAKEIPKLNGTIVNQEKYLYDQVNLGFTVQAGETLYLTVLHNAEQFDKAGFVEVLGELQRHAMGKRLNAEETQGSTIGFSSMARWQVCRHVPILPPHTSLIVAHAASRVGPNGQSVAVMGASYDHRVLSGFNVVRTLQTLVKPPHIE